MTANQAYCAWRDKRVQSDKGSNWARCLQLSFLPKSIMCPPPSLTLPECLLLSLKFRQECKQRFVTQQQEIYTKNNLSL